MSRSRNFEESRKCLDEVKEITRRQNLLREAAREEVDLTPIRLPKPILEERSPFFLGVDKNLRIIFTGETAHVERIQ